MARRLRKTINLGGGVKLNLNAKSASLSAGVPGARVTYNTKGQRTTSVGLPGTGLSYRTTSTVNSGAARPGAPTDSATNRAPNISSDIALPKSKDEKKFEKAVKKSIKNHDALREWLQHPELGEAANILMGMQFMAGQHVDQAVTCFAAALAAAPSPTSAGFLARHPLQVPFDVAGIEVVIPLNRSAASLFLASIYNSQRDSAQAAAVMAHAEPSDMKTALCATFAFNLEQFSEVMEITQWVPSSPDNPMEALALILRACALREMGKPRESINALIGATRGACVSPGLMTLLNFETGRSYAAFGSPSLARNYFVMVHKANPEYRGLSEAMASLPST